MNADRIQFYDIVLLKIKNIRIEKNKRSARSLKKSLKSEAQTLVFYSYHFSFAFVLNNKKKKQLCFVGLLCY
jgi:hypothetical protein